MKTIMFIDYSVCLEAIIGPLLEIKFYYAVNSNIILQEPINFPLMVIIVGFTVLSLFYYLSLS